MIDPVTPLSDRDFSLELLNQLPFKAALLTEKLRITWMNEELGRTLGRDVRGEKTTEVYSDNLDRCEKCPLNEDIPSGKTREVVCEGALGGRQLKILHRGVEIDGKQFVLEIWRDITEEREAKRGLELLNRCNQLLVRATDEEKLLKGICETIVEIGGYELVWIGFPRYDEESSVKFVASAGRDKDILDELKISWGVVEGNGEPTGRAIKSGEIVTTGIGDIETDSRWVKELMARGYSNMASFPLKGKDGIYGALTVLTSVTGVVDERERELLANLADDMTFGIEALRERETRESMEEGLKELSGHLLHAREDERERISRVLHDELGQLATSVIIALSGFRERESVQNDPEAVERVEEMSEIVRSLNEKLRDMARDILPQSLEEEGLNSAVEDYLEGIQNGEEVEIGLVVGNVACVLDSRTQVQLYRVIQEAVTNAISHGDPDKISVRLKKSESRLVLTVEDDGTGFKSKNILEGAREKDRVGLIGMRERVRSLSGSLSVESRPGEGTKVIAEIPFDE